MDRQHGVEEVRLANAMGLRRETEELPVAVEAPRPPGRDDLDGGLTIAIQQLASETNGGILMVESL
jgi:hypothetical protein